MEFELLSPFYIGKLKFKLCSAFPKATYFRQILHILTLELIFLFTAKTCFLKQVQIKTKQNNLENVLIDTPRKNNETLGKLPHPFLPLAFYLSSWRRHAVSWWIRTNHPSSRDHTIPSSPWSMVLRTSSLTIRKMMVFQQNFLCDKWINQKKRKEKCSKLRKLMQWVLHVLYHLERQENENALSNCFPRI